MRSKPKQSWLLRLRENNGFCAPLHSTTGADIMRPSTSVSHGIASGQETNLQKATVQQVIFVGGNFREKLQKLLEIIFMFSDDSIADTR